MKKDKINTLLRAFVEQNLALLPKEREFVTEVYASVRDVLGTANCIQIGSFPRYTAIRPLHDLDVLYVLGDWHEDVDPTEALTDLEKRLHSEYENPTSFKIKISRQTHSVCISFKDGEEEVFAVDVVPAYREGRNEFGDDTYVVPELFMKSHSERQLFMEESSRLGRTMSWITSDPRGYITVASELNKVNEDFRRTAKFVKAWKTSCKEFDKDFPLKSFHLEQIVTEFFGAHATADIFDGVFSFFVHLMDYLDKPQFPDRADSYRYIDAYVADLKPSQLEDIEKARDHFLVNLENMKEGDDVESIIAAGRYTRSSNAEAFLFDQEIPMLTEREFNIVGNVLPRDGSFRAYILDKLGRISVDRRIEFRNGRDAPPADIFKWKVKNDNSSSQPRGEITDHQTQRDPEHSKFKGLHFVECYAIKDGVCFARSRQNVQLD